MSLSRRVLYVTYDGLTEPLGQSQVLPYVRGLAEKGHQFELLSFEKPGTPLRFREKLAPNIHWTALRYHKTPSVPATAYDLAQGLSTALLLTKLGRVDLIHVRSYVPCALVLPIVKALKIALLFDMRGLWGDEKVDSGSWKQNSQVYKLTKKLEHQMLAQANAITVLTYALKKYLREDYFYRNEIQSPIEVISTCTDLKLFSPCRARMNRGDLIYVGSLGGLYMSQEMIQFYLSWRKYAENPRFVLVTKSPVDEIKKVFTEMGLERELVCHSVDNHQVPDLIRSSAAALCFIKPSFSKIGSAPTKLGELLACGLPVAANIIGDMARILENTSAGVIVKEMSQIGLERAAEDLYKRSGEQEAKKEARALAKKWFNLNGAVESYDRIYQSC
ncbi:MAG: glycosyltransferase [Myxococcaceae bacterium]